MKLHSRLSGKPPLATSVDVASRLGCDARPVDPTADAGQLTLMSYVWPDQLHRLARLRAACSVAAQVEATVVQGNAAPWTRRQLAERAQGAATVVFHSIVTQYLAEHERARFETALREAGERASADAPLAWLRMEPADDLTDVRLTVWPGAREQLLARAGYHGDPVEWLG